MWECGATHLRAAAAVDGFVVQVFKSIDGGATWRPTGFGAKKPKGQITSD